MVEKLRSALTAVWDLITMMISALIFSALITVVAFYVACGATFGYLLVMDLAGAR